MVQVTIELDENLEAVLAAFCNYKGKVYNKKDGLKKIILCYYQEVLVKKDYRIIKEENKDGN